MQLNTQSLIGFVTDVMVSAGMKREDAFLFADALVYADMRGVGSHGVTRLATYYRRIREGLVDPKAEVSVLSERPSLIRLDGNNGMGVPLACKAMDMCIEHASVTGTCFASVNHGNHFGCASYFVRRAAEKGMIGIAMANSNKAVAVTGGCEPMLGTNPLAIALPAKGMAPFILDMATSVVARGKIKLAEKEQRPIPEGWGMDKNGTVTTDPSNVAFLMPFGGYKGYGISVVIDILCSVLAGAANSRTMGSFYGFDGSTQNTGFFVGAMDPAAVMDRDEFEAGVAEFLTDMKNSKKAEGVDEIYVAGEKEQRKYEAAKQNGIRISDVIIAELKDTAEKSGVPFDCEMKEA